MNGHITSTTSTSSFLRDGGRDILSELERLGPRKTRVRYLHNFTVDTNVHTSLECVSRVQSLVRALQKCRFYYNQTSWMYVSKNDLVSPESVWRVGSFQHKRKVSLCLVRIKFSYLFHCHYFPLFLMDSCPIVFSFTVSCIYLDPLSFTLILNPP